MALALGWKTGTKCSCTFKAVHAHAHWRRRFPCARAWLYALAKLAVQGEQGVDAVFTAHAVLHFVV